MTQITTNSGQTTVAFGYDDANRQISEEQTLASCPIRRIETTFDADGSRARVHVPGDRYTVNYVHNQRHELFQIRGDDPIATFTRDEAGNVIQLRLDWALGSPTNYAYDALNRVTQIEQGNATAVFARSHYQYDKVGREVATWRDEEGGLGERFSFSRIRSRT